MSLIIANGTEGQHTLIGGAEDGVDKVQARGHSIDAEQDERNALPVCEGKCKKARALDSALAGANTVGCRRGPGLKSVLSDLANPMRDVGRQPLNLKALNLLAEPTLEASAAPEDGQGLMAACRHEGGVVGVAAEPAKDHVLVGGQASMSRLQGVPALLEGGYTVGPVGLHRDRVLGRSPRSTSGLGDGVPKVTWQSERTCASTQPKQDFCPSNGPPDPEGRRALFSFR
ncbi:hypothetical protein [Microvirga makkahensis]|uniref:hypothetical protein n=1 Tax=Microvirga makkahensis TaxID=1128670 RepID=UPI001FE54D04|nr:hypothetical protein [Microvirga makkahensis]